MSTSAEFALDRLTAKSTQYPSLSLLRGSRPESPRYAFRLTARAGQQRWLGCDNLDLAQLPAGALFLDAPLADKGLPNITITPGLTKGEANISGGKYAFLDDKRELGDWLADKAVNRVQLFGGMLEQFELSEDDDLNDPDTFLRALRYTFQIRGSIVANDNVYEFRCEDISRDVDTEIFNKEPFRLYSTVFSGSATIAITLPVADAADHDYTFWFGPDYLVHPGEKRAIIQLGTGDTTEFVSYTGLEPTTVGGVQVLRLKDPVRGLFGTNPVEHVVDEGTETENKPEMPHVAYCEESPASLALACLINRFVDGRAWTHGLNIDERWVDINSFARASDERRRTVRRTKSISAKKYIEARISKMPAIMIPGTTGQLQLKTVQFFQQPQARDVLDESTCYGGDLSPLTHDAKDCKKELIFKWDYDPVRDDYRQQTHIIDLLASGETQATESVEYEDETISTARSTETEVLGIGGVMWAKHALPVKRLSARVMPELAHVRPGDVIQVNHYPRDYKNGTTSEAPLRTPMLVGTLRDFQKSGSVSVDLIGYQAPPPNLLKGSLPLPESAYMENGIPLPGVVNGVAQGAAAINLNQKYYHLGDLTLPASWAPVFAGNGDFELWVRGVLLWAYQLDGKGKGRLAGSRGYHEAPPAAGPWNAHRNMETDSDGGGISTGRVRQFNVRSHPASTVISRQGTIAEQINVERGRIIGLPASLAGSGGAKGEASTWKITKGFGSTPVSDGILEGSAAGNGGMGGKIICFPGSGFVADGGIDCSGGDGAAPTELRLDGYQAAGAGGARGHWAFYTDGVGTTFQGITASTFTAIDGQSQLVGNRLSKASTNSRSLVEFRGYYDPPQDTTNKWADSHTIGVVPASQTAVDSTYLSAFNEFFEDQPDGRATVYEQNARPSDGNKWDLWITPTELRNGGTRPILYVFGESGYELVDWENTRFATVYHSMLAIKRRGGNTLHYGNTRPTEYIDGDEWFDFSANRRWILYAGREDILIGVGDYAVGANKWLDGNLAKYPEEQTIYVFDDLDLDPILAKGAIGSISETGGGGTSTAFGAPTNVTATSTAASVSLTWTPVTGATKYNVERAISNDAFQYLTTTTGSSFSDASVVNGSSYRYRVNAIRGSVGAEEFSDWSSVLSITAQAGGTGSSISTGTVSAPTGLTGRTVSESEIELTWDEQFTSLEGFRLLRAGELIATKSATEYSHLDTGLTAGTVYTYELRAYAGDDESSGDTTTAITAQSTASGGALTAPASLAVAIYSGTAAELSWPAVPPGDRGTGNTYEIEQDGQQIRDTGDANVTSHFMSNLTPGTAYNWRIRLSDGVGGVSPWVDASGTTNP